MWTYGPDPAAPITTVIGVYFLWKPSHRRNIDRSGYLLLGGMAMGWGMFNLVEGIINHHILALHNVRELSPDQDAWNIGFLVFGAALLTLGYGWYRKGERFAHRSSSPGE